MITDFTSFHNLIKQLRKLKNSAPSRALTRICVNSQPRSFARIHIDITKIVSIWWNNLV